MCWWFKELSVILKGFSRNLNKCTVYFYRGNSIGAHLFCLDQHSYTPVSSAVRENNCVWSRGCQLELLVMFCLVRHLTGAATAGRGSSATNAWSTPDASTGPATVPGSATARGTGGACYVIKVCFGFFCLRHMKLPESLLPSYFSILVPVEKNM